MSNMQPPPELVARVARAAGGAVRAWTPVRGGGYSLAERWGVELPSGRSAFVKGAVSDDTARWLRQEHHVYETVTGPFMADVVGWDDDGERPVLLLEDLSHWAWPPAWDARRDDFWSDNRVDAVLQTLELVARSPVPDDARALRTLRGQWTTWTHVADEPLPFLSLEVCSKRWFEASIGTLVAAETSADLDGDDLLHMDVRSDNMCFGAARVVLVDWNWATRGRGVFDVACWLPSLAAEGGPRPDDVLPDAGSYAAWLSGYFAANAGLPAPAGAPRVRQVQLAQLLSSLPWACRALGLQPPDGPAAADAR